MNETIYVMLHPLALILKSIYFIQHALESEPRSPPSSYFTEIFILPYPFHPRGLHLVFVRVWWIYLIECGGPRYLLIYSHTHGTCCPGA